jgi:branched-chain amino acid transport system permease protein
MSDTTTPQSSSTLWDRYASFNNKWYAMPLKGLVIFAILLSLPTMYDLAFLGFTLQDWFSMELFIVVLMFATTAQAWNMMTGFTGYFSFGHAAFFGTGAYITQFLLVDYTINPWLGMLVGALVATIAGLFIGLLTFRYELEGHYFALATLAFAVMFQALVRNMQEFNGAQGFYKPFPSAYASGPGLVAFQFEGPDPYFYLILGFLFVTTAVAWLVKSSAIGVYLFAIKENENAAQSLGIPVFRFKLFAIGISAFFTACVGAFWSMYFTNINTSTVFPITKNVEILLPAVFGGMGTILGPIIGAWAVLPLSELIRQQFGNIVALDRIVYGLAIILIVIYSPRGIVYWPTRLKNLRGWLANNYGIGSAPESGDESAPRGDDD